MIAKVTSGKRLIVDFVVNGKTAPVLLDTGASISILDLSQRKEYGFDTRSKMGGQLTGVGGQASDAYFVKNLDMKLQGLPVYQVVTSDLSGVVESIHQETGIKIAGIIGLPQIKELELKIDPDQGIVKIGY